MPHDDKLPYVYNNKPDAVYGEDCPSFLMAFLPTTHRAISSGSPKSKYLVNLNTNAGLEIPTLGFQRVILMNMCLIKEILKN